LREDFEKILMEFRNQGVQDIFFGEGEDIYIRHLGDIKNSGVMTDRSLMDYLGYSCCGTGTVSEDSAPFDRDMSYTDSSGGRYRLNLFSSSTGRRAVVRIIGKDIPSMEEIGVDRRLYRNITEKKGLSLIAGKTCSGKSTTVASIVKEILKNNPWHVITLEDPVEYCFSGGCGMVTQRELGRDFRSFGEGVISAMRQSPDLIVIGEIRKKETLLSAVTAAETGTAVISTLHSRGARMTLLRMVSMFSSSERELLLFQLSGHLNFIQSQVLLKKEGGMSMDYELLLNTGAVGNTIREGNFSQLENLILLGQSQGMKKFDGE